MPESIAQLFAVSGATGHELLLTAVSHASASGPKRSPYRCDHHGCYRRFADEIAAKVKVRSPYISVQEKPHRSGAALLLFVGVLHRSLLSTALVADTCETKHHKGDASRCRYSRGRCAPKWQGGLKNICSGGRTLELGSFGEDGRSTAPINWPSGVTTTRKDPSEWRRRGEIQKYFPCAQHVVDKA